MLLLSQLGRRFQSMLLWSKSCLWIVVDVPRIVCDLGPACRGGRRGALCRRISTRQKNPEDENNPPGPSGSDRGNFQRVNLSRERITGLRQNLKSGVERFKNFISE